MDTTDNAIFDRIKGLSRENAIEAALTLHDAFGAEDDSDAPYVLDVRDSPDSHADEADDLARLVLLVGAADPELRPTVEEALDAVGQKAFIFGGSEIVALAVLGTYVITLVQSRGKASEEESVETWNDGTVQYTKKSKKISYVAGSGVIGKLLGWVKPN
jgi:hypothetical protein